MKRLIFFSMTLATSALCQSYNTVRIIPTPTHSAVGQLQFFDTAQTNYVGLAAPATLSGNEIWTLPSVDSAGCLQSNGSGVLSFASCGGLTPPVTISDTCSTCSTVTITQGSTGGAMSLYNTGGGTALYVGSGTASFVGLINTNGASFIGMHSQNFGTGDLPTFLGLTVNSSGLTVNGQAVVTGSAYLDGTTTIYSGGSLVVNGSMSGTHGQNVGNADTPSFSGVAVAGTISGGYGYFASAAAAPTMSLYNTGGGNALQVNGGASFSSAVTVSGNLNMGSGNIMMGFGGYYVGSVPGVTSSTCSSFDKGICIAP